MEHADKVKMETEDLLDAFSLNRNTDCIQLSSWLNVEIASLSAETTQNIQRLRHLLRTEGDFWNEEELKMRFLAFLFYYAELDEPDKIKVFYERPLAAVLNHHKLSVKCDCLVAKPKGIGKPTHPYFFLQEFKKQKRQDEDAEGQMLAAMLIAQHLNADDKPIYGAFIQGKFWTFTMLHQKEYCVSTTYDASNEKEIFEILFILKKLKLIILQQHL